MAADREWLERRYEDLDIENEDDARAIKDDLTRLDEEDDAVLP